MIVSSPIPIVTETSKAIKPSASKSGEMRCLGKDFRPGPLDVRCQRGKAAYDHNLHFRDLIQTYLEKYSSACRIEKSIITSEVVDTIRSRSPIGGFVRCIKGVFYEVGDSIAREKVGGCFRDLLHHQYKSSAKAKKRRHAQQDQQQKRTRVETATDTDLSFDQRVTDTSSHVSSKENSTFPATKKFRPDPPARVSPSTTKVASGLGEKLLQILPPTEEQCEFLFLPPPPSLSLSPEEANAVRRASIDTYVSLDVDDDIDVDHTEYELDDFHLKLSRISPVNERHTSVMSFLAMEDATSFNF